MVQTSRVKTKVKTVPLKGGEKFSLKISRRPLPRDHDQNYKTQRRANLESKQSFIVKTRGEGKTHRKQKIKIQTKKQRKRPIPKPSFDVESVKRSNLTTKSLSK